MTKAVGLQPDDEHWVRVLYERYVQLYGDPSEQPITRDNHVCDGPKPLAKNAPEGDREKDPAPSSLHDGT